MIELRWFERRSLTTMNRGLTIGRRVCAAILLLFVLLVSSFAPAMEEPAGKPAAASADRSPVDLVLTRDEQWLLTANQTAGSVSLVQVATGEVKAEVQCGERPSAVALTPDERHVLVTSTFSGDLTILALTEGRLTEAGRVSLGFEPRGIAIAPDGRRAYVALTTADAVAVVDLEQRKELQRIQVGRWPRYLALAPDGKRLAVGVNGDGGVAVIDTTTNERLYLEDFAGLNLGQMEVSADGKYVYFPCIVYRQNPITPGNIRLGWVLASRIARVRLDGKARREAISLDPQGMAVSDPHGLALSPDGKWVISAASGTHELLVYRLPGLPFQDYGGPGDHIDKDLLKDQDRFHRIPLGGRPMAVRFSADNKRVFVANYLLNAVQVVDLEARQVARAIPLGGAAEPSLERQGETIFYDGQRSLDQWYSCHSCHYEGHVNSAVMDTRNDGRNGNFKTVLSLRNVSKTGPWTWHGWQKDYDAAVRKSATDTMLGKEPTPADVKALGAFMGSLRSPPNPHRLPDGGLTEAARRGEKVFNSATAGCANCHSGTFFTDNKIHDVGLGERTDAYKGYNTPSLLGVHDRVLFLHDGRASSLDEVLRRFHNPMNGELTDEEFRDLIAYVKSL